MAKRKASRARKKMQEAAGVPAVSDRQDDRPRPNPLDEGEFRGRVASKAYELFERRGGQPGRDVEDWLEAERLVRQELECVQRAAEAVPELLSGGRPPEDDRGGTKRRGAQGSEGHRLGAQP